VLKGLPPLCKAQLSLTRVLYVSQPPCGSPAPVCSPSGIDFADCRMGSGVSDDPAILPISLLSSFRKVTLRAHGLRGRLFLLEGRWFSRTGCNRRDDPPLFSLAGIGEFPGGCGTFLHDANDSSLANTFSRSWRIFPACGSFGCGFVVRPSLHVLASSTSSTSFCEEIASCGHTMLQRFWSTP